MHKSVPVFIFLIVTAFSLHAQDIDHWEAPVLNTNTWKYIVPASEPPSGWNTIGFDDAAWSSGTGGIGYGDGDDGTTISPCMSVYMRTKFTIADIGAIQQVLFEMDFDDGFVAYLNGVEIARDALGFPGEFIPFDQAADFSHEATMYLGGLPTPFDVDSTLLVAGENVLAISVHNIDITSSDLSSNAFLLFGITDTTSFFAPTPPWFLPPFTTSTLPLVFINTGGVDIPDEPKITADMGIIWHHDTATNHTYDPYNNYNGRIGIEIRGSSSQSFPKKSYSLELDDSLGFPVDSSLVGLPSEDDWILYGPYDDKTFLRDVLTYYLGSKQGWYEPRFKYCELFLNGNYEGIYILLEKIKLQKNRVALNKMTSDDNSGEAVTGGYIFKCDRNDYSSAVVDYWESPFPGDGWPYDVLYVYVDPSADSITTEQKNYISNYMTDFETVMNSTYYTDPDSGYLKYIDINSFVDFIMMQEMCRNVDAYRLSTYFYKNNDAYGGQLFAGPLWDFNLAWGNADYCSAWTTTNFFTDCGTGPTWWTTLFSDTTFANLFYCRWNALRSGPFNTDTILNWIDQQTSILGPAVARNFGVWPVLGQYIWPNYYVGDTYDEEIAYLKTWISDRLDWIDANVPGNPDACSVPLGYQIAITEINYNSDTLNQSGDWVELHNYGNDPLDISNWKLKDGTPFHTYIIPQGTVLPENGYLVLAQNKDTFNLMYPDIVNVDGPFNFGLDNTSDAVRLFDNIGNLVKEVDYTDSMPWPKGCDGLGPTLQINDETADENDPSNWFAGCVLGSPDQPYSPCDYAPTVDEINYNSVSSHQTGDWIEIWNNLAGAIDLSGWKFSDKTNGNLYTIPAGTILSAGSRIVIADSLSAFSAADPWVTNFTGEFPFKLSSAGDAVRLYDPAGKIQYSVYYYPTSPWPEEADGNGYTLEMTDNSNPNFVSHWTAGCLFGSPGAAYTTPCPLLSVDNIPENNISVQPNPFDDELMIQFNSDAISSIVIITDILGNKVAEIQSQNISGTNYVVWNGKNTAGENVSAGTYFVTVADKKGNISSAEVVKSK